MRRSFWASWPILAALTGCVHTTPMPVAESQPGDDTMSCKTIAHKMSEMTTKVSEADSDANGQVAKNVALGVTGVLLIVPWFFMDTSDAHSVEAKAAKARYVRLQEMYDDKGCAKPITPPTTTVSAPVPAS